MIYLQMKYESEKKNAVKDTFEGEAVYITVCQKCKGVTNSKNPFTHLSVNIEVLLFRLNFFNFNHLLLFLE